MSKTSNLWAVVFDDLPAARRAREEVRTLENAQCLIADDVAIVTRLPDGSFEVDREPNPALAVTGGGGLLGFLAGLVVGQPLAGAAVGALLGGTLAATATAARCGISEEFIREVEALMTPGTSVLFVRDEWGDREAARYHLRGLGGKILKTNVDPELVKEVQATLSAPST